MPFSCVGEETFDSAERSDDRETRTRREAVADNGTAAVTRKAADI
jgi:hypothetical protein